MNSQLFKWEKLGQIFDPTTIKNKEWLNEFAQAPATLIFDDFVRVYFSCRPKPDQRGQYVSYSAYIDLERKNLFNIKRISENPILKLGEMGTFDEFGTYPVSVIRVHNEYRIYYAGWTRCESVPFNVAIGMGVSTNADEFKKLGNGPILSYSLDEPFILSGPKIRQFNDIFYLFYIAGREWIMDNNKPEPIYKIRMATSTDGINWKKHDRDLIPSITNMEEAQASPDVIFINGKYHMFFCYRNSRDYRNKKNGYRIGYAYSEDLIHWIRKDEWVGITVSETGWDSEMVSYPHVFKLDGSIYMMYLGNQVGRYGFGLAKLENALL